MTNKFGLLTILQTCSYRDKSNKLRYFCICKCDCGSLKRIGTYHIKSGKTKSCGCMINTQEISGYKKISNRYFDRVKSNANKRNIKFDISIEDCWQKYKEQNGCCSLSGIDIKLQRNIKSRKQTASLDRIDSSKGYTKDNIQWIHKDINRMKSDFEEDYFKFMCRKVSKHESVDINR